MPVPFFVSGLRTAFGQAQKGMWKDTRPDDLLVKLFRANLKTLSEPDDVIVGCAYPEGEQGYNIARTAALGAGLSNPGFTVNRLCGSSLEAAAIAASFVKEGRGTKYLVGGIESMSRVPRRGANFSPSLNISSVCHHTYITMGETAERICQKFPEITRLAQEDFAALSHEKSACAYAQGFYRDHVLDGRSDENIRVPVNRPKLAALPPAFTIDGLVTAATSSPMSDGASCGWVVHEDEVKKREYTDALQMIDTVSASVEPELMGLGPIDAVRRLYSKHHIQSRDIAAFEINEAFAVQVLACQRVLEIPLERLNMWGGALALGHPLGASGLRLLMTLHKQLAVRGEDGALGIAALCVGGGQGIAVLVRYKKFH